MSIFLQRIDNLRNCMVRDSVVAYVIPTSDPHLSEYNPEYWKSREWISGFTGSAGIICITLDKAVLWTDGRYSSQAQKELNGSGFDLVVTNGQFSLKIIEWIINEVKNGDSIALDGQLFSLNSIKDFRDNFEKSGINILDDKDYISEIWNKNRPILPSNPIYLHKLEFAGNTLGEKLMTITQKMQQIGVCYHLVTSLDDIAWILNLRGSDVTFNPVFLSYLIIGMNETQLFIDDSKLSEEVKHYLNKNFVKTQPYDQIIDSIKAISLNNSILINPDDVNYNLYNSLHKQNVVYGKTISRELKACKNYIELDNTRSSMIKDGIALVKAFIWLEHNYKNTKITEYQFGEKIASLRATQENYISESFNPIVGFNENGAIIHYHAIPTNCATITENGLLLVDSGGQYLDGTTDITRTIWIGESEASFHIKEDYTLVLKGNIALSLAIYPEGTLGIQLDTLARIPLWKHGKNYGHGTGHGVGYFMNVHEPPQGFTQMLSTRSTTELKVGMITSNEPGYYKEGHYGIRLENLMVTLPSRKKGFLKHEVLTLFPFDSKLISPDMLTRDEIYTLDAYHQTVYDRLSPYLEDAEQFWLKEKCKKLQS